MAKDYDNMAKSILTDFATDISQFVIGTSYAVEVIENIDTEQHLVVEQLTDSTKRIRINEVEAILHIELQLRDSTFTPMWARNAAYHGYLIKEHQIPVYSNVIYFHPNAGRNDTGSYHYNSHGYEYALRYKVIRLIDIDGQSILEMQAPGLLPFTPLMKRPIGISIEQWVRECISAVAATPYDEQTQGDLFCALSLFGGIIHDPLLFKRMIREERMRESKYYQLLRDEFVALGREQGLEQGREQGLEQGREQGLEQGARESTIRNILKFLNNRFTVEEVNDLIPKLHQITDLERLEQLLFAAPQVQNLDAFKLMLEE